MIILDEGVLRPVRMEGWRGVITRSLSVQMAGDLLGKTLPEKAECVCWHNNSPKALAGRR